MFRYVFGILVIALWCTMAADGIQDGCSNASWHRGTLSGKNSSCQTRYSGHRVSTMLPEMHTGLPEQPAGPMSSSSLPELFALDNYERCLARAGGAYCVLDIDLANVPGQLYDYITAYSAVRDKHYYRARLHRGVCVSERCGLGAGGARGPGLHACMNRTVFQESGLQVGQVKIRYCDSAGQELPAPDALDAAVAALLVALLACAASGTLHHLMLRAGMVRENRYAMAFSAIKNWEILKTGSNSDESEIFQALQGMRFLTMLMIIAAHGILIIAHGYISNPEFIEQTYDDPLKQMMLNGRVIVQTFFVMSGFLLTHYCIKDMFPKPFSISVLHKSTFNRCMRLLPTVLMTMGVTATWVPRLGSGPLWKLLVWEERDICRDGWWRQLLFVQNYFAFDKVCLPQTWYLAADTQLYAAGLLLMVVVWRHQQHARLLFGSVLAASVAVPALQTYFQNMQPIRVSLFPEAFVNLFVDNKTFINAYMSAQANWAGYTLGMVTAYVHHHALRNHWDLRNSTVMRWMFYSSLPVAVLAVRSGSEFHSRAATPLESAAFNALDHNVFAAAICVFMLGCIHKCDRVLRSCVEWAPLQPLGRLSFCALLLHTPVLRTYVGHLTGLLHGSIYNILLIVLGATVITFALSLPMFLLVEQPCCQLQKIFLGSKKKERTAVKDTSPERQRAKAH